MKDIDKNLFDKYVTCLKLFARVSSGLDFLEEYAVRNKMVTEQAHLRSLYILLSFHFELLLKAQFILRSNFETSKEVEEELQKVGHNVVKLGEAIGHDELKNIGILDISIKDKEYFISTNKGVIKIKDFVDIRYDFIPVKGKIKIRIVPKDEIQGIMKSVRLTNEIFKKLKERMNLLRAVS